MGINRGRFEQGDEQITSISEPDLRRIGLALGALPYGAGLAGRVEDVDSLVRWLDAYRDVVRRAADRAADTSLELQTLQSQREGLRAFLGLNEILDRLDEVAPE